tara:strand:- start:38 stop:538 length:501 start_codon:yes stop_codon:yes gene_type:complete
MISSFLNSTIWLDVEEWTISWTIGGTNWFPLLESIHVIAAAMVVGSILWVDLRLLGVAAIQYPIKTMSRESLPWAWGAFAIASVTGVGMFITRAASHVLNPAFQSKIILLMLAGLNMAYFHFKLYKNAEHYESTTASSIQLKIVGSLSLFLWAGVMLAGRWIGHII